MHTDTRHIRSGLVRALAVLAVAPLLVAACGVNNPFAPAAAHNQDPEQMRLKWAQCMRAHGVNVPDPGTQSGPTRIEGSDPQQLQNAENACKQYRPSGGVNGGRADPKVLDAMTKFAQCMRDHGIPMQDPQATNGGGIRISGGDSGTGGGPKGDPESDQFKQAQQACQHYMDQVRPKS
ncbi:MAG TPA: hypothetical protein VGO86_03240 [Candidatus Dormibacteraeota bacterium]